MSQPPNFVDTLSGGIQEVSALLPLLGTEQCERHVGTALDKGYLFAAATPLSIFGSLGIVKTAFATLLATTTKPFYGGRWLSDAGFGTTGSVSSMATLVNDTKQYGAEVQLHRLMKEQHIDNPELVKSIEWFGWRRKNTTDGAGSAGLASSLDLSWNTSLILSSAVLSLVGVTPYLYLIHDDWGHALSWLFPILRSFGSLLCVVTVQFALQIRIHRITTTSLLLMKARKQYPLKIDDAIEDRDTLLEVRLHNLQKELRELGRDYDPEKQLDTTQLSELQDMFEAHSLSEGALMFLLQAILVCGMAMIIAGYVGCFNMVGRTDVKNGPYVWFGMETGLAVLRIALWGWNPAWDEGGTGMTMHLSLCSKDLTFDASLTLSNPKLANIPALTSSTSHTSLEKADAGQLVSTSTIPQFPLITTPLHLSRLTSPFHYAGIWGKEDKEAFVAESVDDFLASATPYVGPLPRLDAGELECILLYYSIVPGIDELRERKLLCMTVCRSDSKWTSISVFIDGDMSRTVFTSQSRDFPGTRALRVTLDSEAQLDSIAIIDRRTLNLLLDYSFRLFSRLCTVDTNSGSQLALSWNVTLPSSLHPGISRESIPLTETDKEYFRIHQIHDLKSDYCLLRRDLLVGVFRVPETRELGLILESAVMEVYLCILEHDFIQSLPTSPTHFRSLALEWIRGMEHRISLEREARRRTWERESSKTSHVIFTYEATYDILVQELRTLRQLPTDSFAIRRWREIIHHPDRPLSVSELLGLPPLNNLEKLRYQFLPTFTVDGKGDVPSPVFHKMVTFLRSSWSRLINARLSSYERIDLYGPESPEFSPPYSMIRQLSDRTSSELSRQFESVQMIDYHPGDDDDVLGFLRFICSLPPSPSLTSLLFTGTRLGKEALSLVQAVLQRHDRIMCVLFNSCGRVDRTHIDQAVAVNRQKWKEDAQSAGVFTYSIGYDNIPAIGDKECSGCCTIYQHELVLTKEAEVVAMIHIPQPGKITVNLSLIPDLSHYVSLAASLTRSASDSITGEVGGATSDGSDHVMDSFFADVVESQLTGFGSVSLDAFSELATGCYELRIQSDDFAYLLKELTIDFIARSTGGEPDIKSKDSEEAGIVMVQEGEEAHREGETSSLKEEGKPIRTLELCPGIQGEELGDYIGSSRTIVERSLRDYENVLICWNMFPDPDQHIKYCSDIWDYLQNGLSRKGEPLFDLTPEVRRLMAKRGTQYRIAACDRIEPLIVPMFGFDTGTHQGEVVRANQKKYASLATSFGWYHKNPEERTGYMQHPIIVESIYKTLYYNRRAPGMRYEWREHFRPLAVQAIAFLFTLIDHCLSKWSTGKYIDREIDEGELIPVYKRHLVRFHEWTELDLLLTKKIRVQWGNQGLAYAQSVMDYGDGLPMSETDRENARYDLELFSMCLDEIELESETDTEADSALESDSGSIIEVRDDASSEESVVDSSSERDTDSVKTRYTQQDPT
ncbi:hypothetical protein AAF712_004467 [Marasmius tenuissimus]|uniref:DUF6532 domain-containing protein n=1 Tax=Marasmius tenuissimus TaxID=585030 RepID=A0ABR3A4T2_9AGAR